MHKNISKLEVVINEKSFSFLCDQDSELPLCKEALFQFLKYIGQIQDAIEDAHKATQVKDDVEKSIEKKIEEITE
jgi:predicted nucleotidyltransferase